MSPGNGHRPLPDQCPFGVRRKRYPVGQITSEVAVPSRTGAVKPRLQKYSALPNIRIILYCSRPAPPKGRCATSSTRGGMRWTLRVLQDEGTRSGRRSRVGLAPRRWCQVRVKERGRRWLKSPVRRGEHGVAVKTIAWGMPGDSGVTCGDYTRVLILFCTRGCGCIERPAFPAPFD